MLTKNKNSLLGLVSGVFRTGIVYIFLVAYFSFNYLQCSTQERQPKKIFMVMLYDKETKVEIAFKQYFVSNNKPVTFVEETVNNSKDRIPYIIKRIKEEKPDLIYIYGTLPTLEIAGVWDAIDAQKNITNIPIVFTGLASPVASKVVKEMGPSGRNVTGLSLSVDLETQLSIIKLYREPKRIAFVYNPVESQSKLILERLKELQKLNDFELIEAPIKIENNVPQESDIPSLIERVKASNADLVYFPSDAFIVKNIKILSEYLINYSLPSFAYNEFMVQNSNTVLFGVFCSLYTLGQKTAMKADAILFGNQKIENIPVEQAEPLSVIFRKDTLKQVKVYPNLAFLELAQGIDETETSKEEAKEKAEAEANKSKEKKAEITKPKEEKTEGNTPSKEKKAEANKSKEKKAEITKPKEEKTEASTPSKEKKAEITKPKEEKIEANAPEAVKEKSSDDNKVCMKSEDNKACTTM